MFVELVEQFREKICKRCNDRELCHKKPNKMMKCGVFYLVSKSE